MLRPSERVDENPSVCRRWPAQHALRFPPRAQGEQAPVAQAPQLAPQLYPSLAAAEAAAGAALAAAPVARFRCLAVAFWLFFCFLAASWPLLPRPVMGLSLRFMACPSESELPAKSLSQSVLSEPLSSQPLSSEPSCSSFVSPSPIIISSSILIIIFFIDVLDRFFWRLD
jgi:hypothetical protein